MSLAFLDKVLPRATNGGMKQWLACIRIIKGNGALCFASLLQKVGRRKVTSVFGIVPIKVANAVCFLAVGAPTQVGLYGCGRSTMGLGFPARSAVRIGVFKYIWTYIMNLHDAVVANDGILRLGHLVVVGLSLDDLFVVENVEKSHLVCVYAVGLVIL